MNVNAFTTSSATSLGSVTGQSRESDAPFFGSFRFAPPEDDAVCSCVGGCFSSAVWAVFLGAFFFDTLPSNAFLFLFLLVEAIVAAMEACTTPSASALLVALTEVLLVASADACRPLPLLLGAVSGFSFNLSSVSPEAHADIALFNAFYWRGRRAVVIT